MNKQQKISKQLNSISQKINNLEKRKNKNQKKQKNSRGKTIKRKRKMAPPYAMMLLDPCNAPLKPGFYGSIQGNGQCLTGIVPQDSGFAGRPYGYIIYFPQFHNLGGSTSPSSWNVVQWWSTLSSDIPTSANFGLEAAAGLLTGHSFEDPAYNFVNSDVCDDARVIGACITASYVGRNDDCSGTITPLTNIPIKWYQGGTGNNVPNIAQMTRFANQRPRRTADGAEVRHRPSSSSSFSFRTVGENLYQTLTGASPQTNQNSHETNASGIGLLFWGTPGPEDFRIEIHKTIEWRPEANIAISNPAPKGSDNPGLVASTINYLDKNMPGWQANTISTTSQILTSAISSMALGGPAPGLNSALRGYMPSQYVTEF